MSGNSILRYPLTLARPEDNDFCACLRAWKKNSHGSSILSCVWGRVFQKRLTAKKTICPTLFSFIINERRWKENLQEVLKKLFWRIIWGPLKRLRISMSPFSRCSLQTVALWFFLNISWNVCSDSVKSNDSAISSSTLFSLQGLHRHAKELRWPLWTRAQWTWHGPRLWLCFYLFQ